MLYLTVIYKTILSIIVTLLSFKISIFATILSFIFIYLIFLLWKNIKKINSSYKFIIISIRILILLLILPLFQNNNFKFETVKNEQQNIGIIIDNSKSIMNTYSEFEINNILDSILIWGNSNNLNLYWYNLDSLITRDNLSFDKDLTNFSSVSNFSVSNNLNQLIILSDGNINAGPSILDLYFSDDIIVNTIGLGSLDDIQNVNIIDVKLNETQDSAIAQIKFKVKSKFDNQKAVFKIYSNSYNKVIYSDSLSIMKGDYFFDQKILLPKTNLDNNLIFSLTPITFSNTDKNITDWNINLNNTKKNKVLLLTGSINYNTSFLKNILNANNNIELVHKILFNNESYSFQKDLDYIILDNFFASDKQANLIDTLHSLDIPILLFEGINSNPMDIKRLLNLFSEEVFDLKKEIKKKDILIDGINISSINSNFSLFLKNNKIFNKTFFFSDSSIALFQDKNICLFLIPDIGEKHFYLKNRYNDSYLNKYISFLIGKHIDPNPIDLMLNKSNYLKGENISFSSNYDIPFQEESKYLIIENIKTGDIDSLLYVNQSIFLNNDGDYKTYFSYKGTNGEVINSNIESFSVNDYSIELSKISQNKDLLKSFSKKFNGKYIDASDFNNSFFSSFNISSNEKKYNYIFSALDLFIREKIYLLVIILFTLEIYLRKRIGLL